MSWTLTTNSRPAPIPKAASLFDFAKPGEAVVNGIDLGDAWTLRFDGACWPNPGGKAGYGFYVLDAGGQTLVEQSGRISGENLTNNVAEWKALIAALEWVVSQDVRPGRLKIEGDSDLIIKQFNATYECHNLRLRALRDEAWRLTNGVPIILSAFWIRREENERADALSTIGMNAEAFQ